MCKQLEITVHPPSGRKLVNISRNKNRQLRQGTILVNTCHHGIQVVNILLGPHLIINMATRPSPPVKIKFLNFISEQVLRNSQLCSIIKVIKYLFNLFLNKLFISIKEKTQWLRCKHNSIRH